MTIISKRNSLAFFGILAEDCIFGISIFATFHGLSKVDSFWRTFFVYTVVYWSCLPLLVKISP